MIGSNLAFHTIGELRNKPLESRFALVRILNTVIGLSGLDS